MKRTILILSTLFFGVTSNACRCVVWTFQEEVTYSDEIFIGTVLNKASAEKAYYTFSISQMFKGDKADSLIIKTGLGGPDCGMVFEIGKTYIVYSQHKETSRCRRNSLASNSADIGKLKYLFQNTFSSDIGLTSKPLLTPNEAEYFNSELLAIRKGFNFQQKKVAFIFNDTLLDKQQYFNNWGGKDFSADLILLTPAEKLNASDYDAIIISKRKHAINNSRRKRLIKKLK